MNSFLEYSTKSLSCCLSTLEDKLQCMNIEADCRSSSPSREDMRDLSHSGYLSHSGFKTTTSLNSFRPELLTGQTLEAHLRPHALGGEV